MKHFCILTGIVFNLCTILCLENGLARTPPMGWLSWERFRCNIQCDKDPSNCISEKLFMDMADKLVSDGYKDAGYEYVNLDDCWMAKERDKNGDLIADVDRFPRGIHFLADYMHARGLKLGIYQNYNVKTCMGFPGSLNHVKQDAQKFAEWDVDMLKLDGCFFSDLKGLDKGYIEMGNYLKSFGKPILYSCSWPYYQLFANVEPNYTLISSHCNLWRNYHDISDSWDAIQQVIDFFGDNQEVHAPHIGPGHWADPDMIMVGNRHLTLGQSRAQMAIWAVIPGPLLMSNDLRDIKPATKEILLNKKLIGVNQDRLGIPGKRVYKENKLEIWKRPILPSVNGEISYAVVFLNRHFKRAMVNLTLSELDLNKKYFVSNVFKDENFILNGIDTLSVKVRPMDVTMLHFEILP